MGVNSIYNSILLKYHLSPYLHTLIHRHTAQKRMIVRPMWVNFADDMMVREERFDHEFMWGDSLLIVPITEESSDVYFYLPKENGETQYWYDYNNLITTGPTQLTSGIWSKQNVSSAVTGVFMKGGSIITNSQATFEISNA